MREIAALTGQAEIVIEIEHKLGTLRPLRGLIEGPSGGGKSWIFEQLLKRWQGASHKGIVAAGDRAFTDRSYAAWFSGISQAEDRFGSRRLMKETVTDTTDLVPSAGKLVSFLAETLLNSRERHQRSKSLQLTDGEHEILFRLQALAGDKPFLLLADDLQFWDKDSLRLLAVILSSRLDKIYPFLTRTHLLATATRGWNPAFSDLWRQVMGYLDRNRWHLEYVSEDRLAPILRAFGLEFEFPKQQIDVIYSVAGGHLEMLRQLVDYYACNDVTTRCSGDARIAPGLTIYQVLNAFVKERLDQMGVEGQKAFDFLLATSVIGRSFTDLEAQCIMGSPPDLHAVLETAEKLKLVKRDKQTIRFYHESLRESFLNATASRAPEFHRAFARCLSFLRPSDYITRAEHLLLGRDDDLAAQLYFVALLRMKRECEPIKDDFSERICSMMKDLGYENPCTLIVDAYNNFRNENYSSAAHLLERIEVIYPDVLLAERDYLLALCKLKKFNSSDNLKALEMLSRWEHLRDNESDLWSRLQMTRLVACTRTGDFNLARQIERSLGKYYASLRRSDPSADTAINMLRRKSASLYGAEVAAERCRLAVAYFGAGSTNDLPRSPVQYYMGLCNLSGNLLVTGEFEASRNMAQLATTFWTKFQDIALPRIEVALNNLVISGYFSGALNANDALQTMAKMEFGSRESPDKYLLVNNYIVLTALVGKLEEAIQIGTPFFESLGPNSSDDGYYRYFLGTNLSSCLHLVGKTNAAIEIWRQLEVPLIPDADMPFLLARHTGQEKAFAVVPPGDIDGWNHFLSRTDTSSLGRPWAFYGKGFLFSDIQFWSES